MSCKTGVFQGALSSAGKAMGCCQQSQVCSKGAATLSSYFTTEGFLHIQVVLDGKRSVQFPLQTQMVCGSLEGDDTGPVNGFKEMVEVNSCPSSKGLL